MFESLKHWFDSLAEESKIFAHAEDEALHTALASVLYHIINCDNLVTEKEKHEFATILKQEFDLNDEQVKHLYESAQSSTSELLDDLHTVNRYLKDNPHLRMNFMKKLNHLVCLEGVKDRGLDIFYAELHEVFPNIKCE